jgi:molecular chaperone HtpG
MTMNGASSFPVGIHFVNMLRTISKQIYETPMAFIRENAQNAVDAIRIQADRDSKALNDPVYRVDVTVNETKIVVRDNGNGMTRDDLRKFFWTIGASGKQTDEAKRAGCVGMFGIGGFANFGVCTKLEVVSQAESDSVGTYTALSLDDIDKAQANIPDVKEAESTDAAPRGTIVVGWLKQPPVIDELKRYLEDFVSHVPAAVFFNERLISQQPFLDLEGKENLTAIGNEALLWTDGDLSVTARLWEDRAHTIHAAISSMQINGSDYPLQGQLRFEHGPIDVFKRGFKLCATTVGSEVGVTGRMDSDLFTPTAGRDSLDGATTATLGRLIQCLEKHVAEIILASSERLERHTRIFHLIRRLGWVDRIGKSLIRAADGNDIALEVVRDRSAKGVAVFYGTQHKQALSQVMMARGHLVLLLSSDPHKQAAETEYLDRLCKGKRFTGVVECRTVYEDLSLFEKIVLSEIETVVARSYEILKFRVIGASLTEDIPAFVREPDGFEGLEIIVDVRHDEVRKLEVLGFSSLLYSVLATFAREYLGPSLKKWSPRFFGDGALNLELLAKQRSELWILVKDDIGVIQKGAERQLVTSSDVRVVNVGAPQEQVESAQGQKPPKILKIVDEHHQTDLAGHYIRLPDTAYRAYADLIQEYDHRGVMWGGNKIGYVASDAMSASFQYEIRLDEVIAVQDGTTTRAEGAQQITKPLQLMFDGLYFPIPVPLERYLVPVGEISIRLQVDCDLFDMKTARHWISAME